LVAAQITVFAMLALVLAQENGTPASEIGRFVHALERLPELMESALTSINESMKELAIPFRYVEVRHCCAFLANFSSTNSLNGAFYLCNLLPSHPL
jgi:hypothetical protein